jgi:hypothetical protein
VRIHAPIAAGTKASPMYMPALPFGAILPI